MAAGSKEGILVSTNKPELIICRGLQGSGKTTWARNWVALDRANRVRVNRDDLRQMVDKGVYEHGVTEGRIIAARDALITTWLMRGLSVVSDDTNLAARQVKDLAKLAHYRAYPWNVRDFTDVPVEVCIERDMSRGAMAYVGKTVIMNTYERYLKERELPLPVPTEEELGAMSDQEGALYVPPEGACPAIIIDIDGTVALRGTRDPFDESRVHEDRPNEPVVEIIQRDIEAGMFPIFCSGRTDNCRLATWNWIMNNVMHVFGRRALFELHMRKAGDGRKDAIIKKEIFDRHIRNEFNIRRVYDDRNQVVQMWRSLGLTVLQVAEGAF
jgi:predicted kinase